MNTPRLRAGLSYFLDTRGFMSNTEASATTRRDKNPRAHLEPLENPNGTECEPEQTSPLGVPSEVWHHVISPPPPASTNLTRLVVDFL